MRYFEQKKGFYFLFDAMFAAALLILGLVAVSEISSPQSDINNIDYLSKDLLNTLAALKIEDFNETNANVSFFVDEIENGNMSPEHTLLEQIGEYWARGETGKASQILKHALNSSGIDFNIQILAIDSYRTNLDMLYNSTYSEGFEELVSSRRMISGIEEGKPLTGSTSTAYLRKIDNKRTSSYAYFGGFVGQGNVTVLLNLPSDYNSSNLASANLKIAVRGDFYLYINGAQCQGLFNISENTTDETVSLWNVTSCGNLLVPYYNNISLRFADNMNVSYIAGGFFKALYSTALISTAASRGYKRYYFPDVSGVINLYDAISAQGNIQNWTLNITFFNAYPTYFNFGNDTLFELPGNETTVQNIVYSKVNQNLVQEPIPIRLGIQNFSNVTTLVSGVTADTFLVTDVSGSMGECVGVSRNCSYQYRKVIGGPYFPINCMVNDENLCDGNPDNPCGGSPFVRGRNYNPACNQSMLDIAKAADISFINNIFNNSLLHNVGLVDFSTSANPITNLTNNAAILINEIGLYVASGATCSCCGINRARDALNSSSARKYIVFLSDGDPTLYCHNLSDYYGSGVWGGDTSTGSSSATDRNWTILAGQEACKNNITVYAIGFGTGMSAGGIDTMQKTACNLSLYFNASDTSQLASIYANISRDVTLAANFSSQTVMVIGNYTPSRLYGSSYIDIYFDPVADSTSQQNRISIASESAQFNGCNTSILIPSDIDVIDAFVTSYSASHWTKNVVVNDFLVFNLTKYGNDYSVLGDPFLIEIPSVIMKSGGYNNISLRVGDNSTLDANCSMNNTLIYSFMVNSTVPRSSVLSSNQGCNWTIEFEDGSSEHSPIPPNYYGNSTCYYNSSGQHYKNYDSYDTSVYAILSQLDFDDDGRVDINLDAQDLEVIVTTVEAVPYLWGPSIIEARIWK